MRRSKAQIVSGTIADSAPMTEPTLIVAVGGWHGPAVVLAENNLLTVMFAELISNTATDLLIVLTALLVVANLGMEP